MTLQLFFGWVCMVIPCVPTGRLLLLCRHNIVRWTCYLPRWLCLPG